MDILSLLALVQPFVIMGVYHVYKTDWDPQLSVNNIDRDNELNTLRERISSIEGELERVKGDCIKEKHSMEYKILAISDKLKKFVEISKVGEEPPSTAGADLTMKLSIVCLAAVQVVMAIFITIVYVRLSKFKPVITPKESDQMLNNNDGKDEDSAT